MNTTFETTSVGTGARPWSVNRVALGAAALLVALVLVANLWVIVGDEPQIFNQKAAEFRILTWGLAGFEAALLAVLLVHLRTGRLRMSASFGGQLVLTLLVLDLLVGILDTAFVSVDHALFIKNLRNVYRGSEVLPLPQSTAVSPFGFRMARAEPLVSPDYRVLVLGNSFTHGSGSTFATNYPQVLEKALQDGGFRSGKVSVFAAGVDGYGLEEMLKLYRLLNADGYRFDAVLLNVMMGSDLSNDVPRTWRRAMAGEPQRFHTAPFVSQFFPVNSYLFRYIYYVYTISNAAVPANPSPAPGVPPTGRQACVLSRNFRSFATERIREYYARGDRTKIYTDYNLGFADELLDLARSNGQSTFIVLQPDANAALDTRRALVPDLDADWDRNRSVVSARLSAKGPLLDLAPPFRNRDDLFRCNDTHWTNDGNVVAGDAVAAWMRSVAR